MTKLVLILFSTATMFIISTHPMILTMILLINTIIIALCSGLMLMSFWYSYMMVMIMIGGMLVLIIYMTSIASNEMMEKMWKYIPILTLMIMGLFMSDSLLMNFFAHTTDTTGPISLPFNTSLSKFISKSHMSIIVLMINYLFITLIAIVKITNIKYGSLRQKF